MSWTASNLHVTKARTKILLEKTITKHVCQRKHSQWILGCSCSNTGQSGILQGIFHCTLCCKQLWSSGSIILQFGMLIWIYNVCYLNFLSRDCSFCQMFQIEGSCRLIVFVLMMISNALMLAYFLDALEKESSSLMVTAISTSVNFISTGVIGNFLFAEAVSSTWYGGALLTSCGAALISFSQAQPAGERKPI